MKSRILLGIIAIIMLIFVSACDANLLQQPSGPSQPEGSAIDKGEPPLDSEPLTQSAATPGLPQALIDFRVLVPDDTPTTDTIYLTVLDEVTGLYLNAESYTLVLDNETGIYSIQLPFVVGSVVKYRYERQADDLRVAEHTSDGSPVRYRMLVVHGPGSSDDVVSRWTDSQYSFPSGRIQGQASDAVSGLPIPNLLISAGGAQTFTTSDGSFLIEGLPPGIHNLVGYALDGAYHTFQQGAEVAADSTTPTPVKLEPATLVNITFRLTPPANTPPVVPVRLAGNLYQLGNTFGTLTGGVNTLATRMPVLAPQPDGSYQITLALPSGADIRYKYSLGDGYWNAEHITTGDFLVRQLIVPAEDTAIQDLVSTWETNPGQMITFDITVPKNTPADDYISIQFNPLFGWTEPVPMWSLGNNRWAYILYSPTNLPGNLSYRYCRNNQCGVADDAATPGKFGAGRSVNLGQLPLAVKESVESWVGLDQTIDPAAYQAAGVTPRGETFLVGIEFEPNYHPSWQPLWAASVGRATQVGANWLIIDPTWSATRINPPVLEPVAGQDALWPDLINSIQQAHSQGAKVALYPTPSYVRIPVPTCTVSPCPSAADVWWQEGARDYSWWLVWFEQYRKFALHHADLAASQGAEALVLGGEGFSPALPGGTLVDGQPSGVLADAETRWRSLLAEIRQRYPGILIWAMPYKEGQAAPVFLDAIDQIALEWTVQPGSQETPAPAAADLEAIIAEQLDSSIQALQAASGKPLIVSLKVPSNPSLEYQLNIYQAMLTALNQRPWLSGFISKAYYPPAQIQDSSASLNGKPGEAMLQSWYLQLVNPVP